MKNFADIEDRSPADVGMGWHCARKELICVGGPAPDGGDGERVDGFWD